jgi:hypothetical protein
MGHSHIAGIGPADAQTTVAGEWTDVVDLDDSGRVDVAVDTTGAAALTIDFSRSGDFNGEEWTVDVAYDAAEEIIEQFDPAHQYVRAQVDTNLNRLEVVSRGV